jgi:hypothetical protein
MTTSHSSSMSRNARPPFITRSGNILWAVAVLILALILPGCSHVAYSEAEHPNAEVATLNCYFRIYLFYWQSCSFDAIDSSGPLFGRHTLIMLPGTHTISLHVMHTTPSSSSIGERCTFTYDFMPGYTYKVLAHGIEVNKSRDGKNGSLEMRITPPSGKGHEEIIGATCSFRGR